MKLITIGDKAVNPQHVAAVSKANTWAGDDTIIYFVGGAHMMVKAPADEVIRAVNEALGD